MPDVYVYDEISQKLRIQITHIWDDILSESEYHEERNLEFENYSEIINVLYREYGVYKLANKNNDKDDLLVFFLKEQNVDKILDVIELSFIIIDTKRSIDYYHYNKDSIEKINKSIEELNHRFKEHGVGYQYENGQIIRTDSQLIHAEVVQPALQLLNEKNYAGAQEEFLKAHEHYRNGNAKEALNECLKSFESVMKSICDKNNWDYDEGATSSNLINVCLENNLIPLYWQSHYSALRSLLESSVPTARNKLSGHGQGSDIKSVPDYLVAYMLHMTASAIVFLVEAEKNL